MKVTVKVGKTDGRESSFNLFFESGLRLATESLVFKTVDEKKAIREQFNEVLEALAKAGWDIEGIRLV